MTTSDLWALCVESDYSRYNIGKPFIQNGWRYATDGRIAIREPAPGESDSEGKYPRMVELFKPAKCTEPWPEPTGEVRWDRCDDCCGSGVAHDICPECNGKGMEECPKSGNVEECGKCKGAGTIPTDMPCPVCNGQKVVACPMQTVDGRWLDARYTQALYELGAMFYRNGRRYSVLEFRIGMIEGRLLPRDKALSD